MANHRPNPPQGEAYGIAQELISLIMFSQEPLELAIQDPQPYESPDMAYFRVTGTDGETYYVQVSKRKQI